VAIRARVFAEVLVEEASSAARTKPAADWDGRHGGAAFLLVVAFSVRRLNGGGDRKPVKTPRLAQYEQQQGNGSCCTR
jgi:hypothetical protein